MLTFNPNKRVNADDALNHPFFTKHKLPPSEDVCPTPKGFEFEVQELSREEYRGVSQPWKVLTFFLELVYQEALSFHPEAMNNTEQQQKQVFQIVKRSPEENQHHHQQQQQQHNTQNYNNQYEGGDQEMWEM